MQKKTVVFLGVYLENEEMSYEIGQERFFSSKLSFCKLRVILRSRALQSAYPREGYQVGEPPAIIMPGSTGLKTLSLVLRMEPV